MKLYIASLIALLSLPVMANTTSLPAKPVIGINASEVGKRVCYYQDQAYSNGAIIQIDEYYMICSAANTYEKNGVLKWNRLDDFQAEKATQQPQSEKPKKRYSVN
ncbi:DUF1496 domain-containing protein [Vibrio sp. M260118]|uniref:DUF1496 domain-containing protein n=1 Tax=Vibrio sp. M260118 TaxID=3020896 RepID=UPI002F413738